MLTFELRNVRPVDLLDLTGSLSALGEAYKDYITDAGIDITHGNVRLFIRELRSGSVIADLVSMAEQSSFLLDHVDAAAGFITHYSQILDYFFTLPESVARLPSKRDATHAISVMKPVAKDGGSQLILNAGAIAGDVHIHYQCDSRQANAIQNSARRSLGPALPQSQIYQDQFLVLHQVHGDASANTGDRGVIEALSPAPAKLIFLSEQVKKLIVDQPENPFQKVFLVDVEARAAEGKIRMYRILDVKDVLDR